MLYEEYIIHRAKTDRHTAALIELTENTDVVDLNDIKSAQYAIMILDDSISTYTKLKTHLADKMQTAMKEQFELGNVYGHECKICPVFEKVRRTVDIQKVESELPEFLDEMRAAASERAKHTYKMTIGDLEARLGKARAASYCIMPEATITHYELAVLPPAEIDYEV